MRKEVPFTFRNRSKVRVETVGLELDSSPIYDEQTQRTSFAGDVDSLLAAKTVTTKCNLLIDDSD